MMLAGPGARCVFSFGRRLFFAVRSYQSDPVGASYRRISGIAGAIFFVDLCRALRVGKPLSYKAYKHFLLLNRPSPWYELPHL